MDENNTTWQVLVLAEGTWEEILNTTYEFETEQKAVEKAIVLCKEDESQSWMYGIFEMKYILRPDYPQRVFLSNAARGIQEYTIAASQAARKG